MTAFVRRDIDAFLEVRLVGTAGILALDLNFSLKRNWTALFGPSGAGKSTILHALCGMVPSLEQRLFCDGDDLSRTPTHLRRFALVSQRTLLFPHLSAKDNVLFGLHARNDVRQLRRGGEADRLLGQFRATAFAHKFPHQLSGGEQQRIALARAVASRPRLLLLDEALTGLERSLRWDLLTELRTWQHTSGMSILSVTHDIAEASTTADDVLRLEGGRIVAQGPPAEVLRDERLAMLQVLERTGAGPA